MKKTLLINDQQAEVEIINQSQDAVVFIFEGAEFSFNKNNIYKEVVASAPHFVVQGLEIKVETMTNNRSKKVLADHGQMRSPMPGKILKILVAEGASITAGTPLIIMEAMKMEHTIKASKDGVIAKIHFKEDSLVNAGVELVSIC